MKNILITGKPRVGKTTLIKRLVEHLDSAGDNRESIYQTITNGKLF